ncbi:MAG: hypothetical protein ACR2Q4_13705 [Geminicoccaceae bacterium]
MARDELLDPRRKATFAHLSHLQAKAPQQSTDTVLDASAGGQINTSSIDAEIVAFIFGQSGLMLNASLEGTKVTKINFDL